MSSLSVNTASSSLARIPRRVVVISLPTYSEIGGLQNFNRRVFENLAKRSVERGECFPLVLINGDEAAAIPPIEGIEIEGIKNRLAFAAKSFWAAVARGNILIICHLNLLPLAALVRCLRPKLPILVFVHGYEAWNQPSIRRKRWYEGFCLRAVTRIASVSTFTAETMAREFGVPKAKFRLLPNAVDPIELPARPDERRRMTILTVSRLSRGDRYKNVDKMIRAVAELRTRLPGLTYDIIGDGGLRPELEALAKDLGVAEIVKFHGQVGEAELHAAYARASVFAMPSSKEGFGIVFLEAWQWGTPVICSRLGASKEVVTDGIDGFVVDPEDISMIADRSSLLLTRPDLAAAMGERGRQKVAEKYLNPVFRRNLDGILDELLG